MTEERREEEASLKVEEDARIRRLAHYLRNVLPPEPGGSFDVITGEAYLEPPPDDRDPALLKELAETAMAKIVDNDELEAELNDLLEILANEPDVEELEIPGGGFDVQYVPPIEEIPTADKDV